MILLWPHKWPPFEVARRGVLRRLWLYSVTQNFAAEPRELWIDPSTIAAVGVADRFTLSHYGERDKGETCEASVVYVGRVNPVQVLVLGSPEQVFRLLEVTP